MAALPYMPLYVADYLADAAHLSTVQHGAYLLLIMTYWQRGEALPNNDKRLARITRMTDKEWGEVRDDIAEFFDVGDGVWRQGRIEHELEKVRSKVDQASRAGQASAKRRSNGRATGDERQSNHTDTDTDTDTEETPSESPPYTPRQIFDAWNTMAKEHGLSVAVKLNDTRTKALRVRLDEHDGPQIVAAIGMIPQSDFLMGRRGNSDWRATIDWLCQPSSMLKLLEGAYHGGGTDRQGAGASNGKADGFTIALREAGRALGNRAPDDDGGIAGVA